MKYEYLVSHMAWVTSLAWAIASIQFQETRLQEVPPILRWLDVGAFFV